MGRGMGSGLGRSVVGKCTGRFIRLPLQSSRHIRHDLPGDFTQHLIAHAGYHGLHQRIHQHGISQQGLNYGPGLLRRNRFGIFREDASRGWRWD